MARRHSLVAERRRIVMVAFPDFQLLDVTGPLEVFGRTARWLVEQGHRTDLAYTTEIVAASAGPLVSSSGITLVAERAYTKAGSGIDTLMIAGGRGAQPAAGDTSLIAWLRRTAPRVRRVASVCTGTFILGAAGLLDGRRATTHWESCDALARLHPRITVDPSPIFTRDGHIYTSAGVTAGMDLALAMVEDDLGRHVALQVARRLVMFLRRPGGQSQFSVHLSVQQADREPLRDLQGWIADHLSEDLSNGALADRVSMSPRHFARVFTEEVGVTPARYVRAVARGSRATATRRVVGLGRSHSLDVRVRDSRIDAAGVPESHQGVPNRLSRALLEPFGSSARSETVEHSRQPLASLTPDQSGATIPPRKEVPPTMRFILVVLATVVSVAAVPGLALAQSAIVGVVKDATGAVVPGVTVEAASDALIERVKSATTDNSGQYRIVDLRPGMYVVTFALTGFQTVRRQGVQLRAEFNATVDAEMKVGDREETVTVTAEAPTVDVRSAAVVTRLDREVLDQIPTGQNIWEMAQLIPSINLFNVLAQNAGSVGGQGGATQTYMSVRGMNASQNVVLVDGMSVSGLELNGTIQAYFNADMNQEIDYQTSGASADRSGGGVTVNMIPRDGGNRPSGNFKTNYRPGRWIGDNFTARLRDMGMLSSGTLEYLSDFTGSQGGPIKRDRLWFFASYHQFNTGDAVPGTLLDDGAQGTDTQHIRQPMARLTYQLTPSNKVSGYLEITDKQRSHDMVSQVDPETAASRWTSPNYSTGNVKFTSTMSSRLLVEGGYSMNREYRTVQAQEGIYKDRGTPEWYASASRTLQTGGNARTTAPTTSFTHDWPARDNAQASVSYITGSHQMKVGFQYQWGRFYHFVDANADLTQRYANVTAVGNELTFSNPADVVVRNTPVSSIDRLNRDVGIYAQDSWTTKRLTVNYGVRWEHINAQNDAYAVPAGRFTPERSIPAVKNVPNWSDWAPRFNMVYDLFGTSKTALKYSLNRYNFAAGTALANSFNTLTSTTRTLPWTDVNSDGIAQGNPVVNPDGSYAPCVGYPSLVCEIDMAALRSTNGTWFGTPADADVYSGFPRQWSVESALEVQHELLPRLSVTAGWTRSDDYNLRKTINRFRQNGDYVPVTIFNPITGDPITIYSIKDAATRARLAQSGANLEYVEDERKAPYNQYSIEFRARPYRGAQIFGGFVASRLDSVNCGTSRSDLVVNQNDEFYCDTTAIHQPIAKDFRFVVSFPIRYGVTLGVTYLNNDEGGFQPTYAIVPGTSAAATRYPDGAANSTRTVANQPAPSCPTHAGCAPGAPVLPSGFILPLGATSITVPLEPPGVTRRERLQQLDLRLSKTFRIERLTIGPTLDVYNALNSDKIFSYQSANYANTSGTYLVPSTILLGRVIGVGALVRW